MEVTEKRGTTDRQREGEGIGRGGRERGELEREKERDMVRNLITASC